MEKNRLNVDIPGSITELQLVIKEFEIKAKLYRNLFRGKGLEFDGYQTYYPKDDAASIDWKASVRANKLLMKHYKEERNLKIIFAVDVSEHMVFGSTAKLKCEYATEVLTSLAYLIISSGDNIGFILFNDKVLDYVMPSKGLKQFELFADALSNARNYGGKSDINNVIKFILNYLDESTSAVILLSDFIKLKEDAKENFKILSKKFEVMALMVKDPLDKTLPDISAEVVIEDPLSGGQMLINPKLAKKSYEKYALEQENLVKKIFTEANIDLLSLMTDKLFVPALAEFLRGRVKRKSRLIS